MNVFFVCFILFFLLKVYHSCHNAKASTYQSVCKASVVPLKSGSVKGPAPEHRGSDPDIVDEALTLFRANILFNTFEVEGNADRTLVYLTAWIADCLRALTKEKTKV